MPNRRIRRPRPAATSPSPESTPESTGQGVRLPGVGTRWDLTDADDTAFSITGRDDGSWDLYVPAEDRPTTLRLSEVGARSVGALLAGRFAIDVALAERLRGVRGGLVIDWVHLPASAHAVGYSIEELQIRRRTGATIIAILRGSLPIVAPDPATRLEADDELVVACRPNDFDQLVAFIEGQS